LLCEPSPLAVLRDEPSRALCHRAGARRSLRVERIDCALDDEPNNIYRKVPTRKLNADRTREYLTPAEVEKLIAAAKPQ
jgi:hypothetical protein